ncbi:MAG: stage III sporulation protein AE [Lachnospiraceae bacterium]
MKRTGIGIGRKSYVFILIIVIFMIPIKGNAKGTPYSPTMDFSEIDAFMKEQTLLPQVTFKGLVEGVLSGDFNDTKEILAYGEALVKKNVLAQKGTVLQIGMLLLTFAVINQFIGVFEKKELASYGYYVFYLAIASLLLKSYLIVHQVLAGALETIIEFMHGLLPVFCVSLLFGTGHATATGFYLVVLFVIYLVEWVFLYIGVPALHVFLAFQMANYAIGDGMFQKMLRLFQDFFRWGIKSAMALVVGLNMVQGLITPAVDQLKHSSIVRVGTMIPGIGNAFGSVAEMVIGSGVILKNAVGVAGMAALILLAAGPLIQLIITTISLRLVAALGEPFGDKQLTGFIHGVGETVGLMTKMMLGAVAMFFVTLAILTAASGRF